MWRTLTTSHKKLINSRTMLSLYCNTVFVTKHISEFWTEGKKDLLLLLYQNLSLALTIKSCTTTKHRNQINTGRYRSPATSNILIYVLLPWTVVTKGFMLHVSGFLDFPQRKESANNLKIYRRTKSFTNILRRVSKSFIRCIV